MSDALKTNVLLVDDEEKFLDVLSQRLQGHDIKADTATSGEDAIEKVKSKVFDAIVLDLGMPGIGGIETLKRIRKENPELQIIILSGRGTVEKTVEAMKEGAMDFLEKPADLNKLLDKIGEAKHKRILLAMEEIERKVKGGTRRL